MTTTTKLRNRALSYQPTVFMQNQPVPIGTSRGTRTTFYSRGRYSFPFLESSRNEIFHFRVDFDEKESFSRAEHSQSIYNMLQDTLNKITTQVEFQPSFEKDVFILGVGDRISQAVGSWVFPELSAPTLPLLFHAIGVKLSNEVLAFSYRFGTLRFLPFAVQLLKKYFPSSFEIQFQIEQDPDSEDEWLAIDFTVKDDLHEFMKAYDSYTTEWISLVPWPYQNRIRLSFNVI